MTGDTYPYYAFSYLIIFVVYFLEINVGESAVNVDTHLETLGLGDVTVSKYGTCHSIGYNIEWKNTPGDIAPLQVRSPGDGHVNIRQYHRSSYKRRT